MSDAQGWICGGRTKAGHFFTKDLKAVFHCNNLWYDPDLVLKRNRGESVARFRSRVKVKLGFAPYTYAGWWRVVAVPELRALKRKS